MHIYYLGAFAFILFLIAGAVMVYAEDKYRFIVGGIGCAMVALLIWTPLHWYPSQRVTAIYPCDQTSPDYLKHMHIVMSDIRIPSDTTIINFDLMTAHCGDTLHAYLLVRQSAYGIFHNGRTRTVISRYPMPQYEGKLTAPWLY